MQAFHPLALAKRPYLIDNVRDLQQDLLLIYQYQCLAYWFPRANAIDDCSQYGQSVVTFVTMTQIHSAVAVVPQTNSEACSYDLQISYPKYLIE